jgi:hypothetical protein
VTRPVFSYAERGSKYGYEKEYIVYPDGLVIFVLMEERRRRRDASGHYHRHLADLEMAPAAPGWLRRTLEAARLLLSSKRVPAEDRTLPMPSSLANARVSASQREEDQAA